MKCIFWMEKILSISWIEFKLNDGSKRKSADVDRPTVWPSLRKSPSSLCFSLFFSLSVLGFFFLSQPDMTQHHLTEWITMATQGSAHGDQEKKETQRSRPKGKYDREKDGREVAWGGGGEMRGLKNIEKMVSVKMKVRKVSELSRDRRGKCKVTSLGL